MNQPLLEQLSSFETLQSAADWLKTDCPQYQPDLDVLAAKLESGDYCFQPLTTVQKTNKLGESETLEVWEAQDRLVLKAMSLVLKDHLSDELSTCCHHLEGRGGIKKAVRKTREFIQNNPESWVLKTDVQGYYAHIDHMVLYNQLQALIPNEDYLLRLTWQFLKRTVYDGGNYYDRDQGISLGSPLSPLMAALYLTPLDEAFDDKEWFYARFMDDWVIITPTRWKLNSAVKKVNMILNQHKLTKAYDKTFIGRSSKGFDLLGYHFTPESLTMGKNSLQRRDARIPQLNEQGADEVRIGEYVSRWQQWAKAGLQDQLTETKEFNYIPRQADSSKLPLEAKFLALGIASVMSTAAFDSHATILQLGEGTTTTTWGCVLSSAFYIYNANTASFSQYYWGAGNQFYANPGVWIYNATGGFFPTGDSYEFYGNTSLTSAQTSLAVTEFNNSTAAQQIVVIQDPNSLEWGWVRYNVTLASFNNIASNDIKGIISYGISTDGSVKPTLANTTGLTTTDCSGPTAVAADINNPVVTLVLGAAFSGIGAAAIRKRKLKLQSDDKPLD
ncbi:reverse transcriptase domain-containing protein [Candidatus Halobeggiatoa sp. HSG11]|nr:reverse transcriptase domain-containing protein [Candidatus Halobeggiatoa sp. HSG11]